MIKKISLQNSILLRAFGGATEAYNYYRKTGFPTTVLPNQIDPGAFPRSFLYPQNEVITNSVARKTTLTQKVFWDTNADSPIPSAN